MKKLVLSAVMCIALLASTSVMAQDKKECCKTKTECTKDKKEAKDKSECTKKDKKECKDTEKCTKEKDSKKDASATKSSCCSTEKAKK